jgi:hypothetical protein
MPQPTPQRVKLALRQQPMLQQHQLLLQPRRNNPVRPSA